MLRVPSRFTLQKRLLSLAKGTWATLWKITSTPWQAAAIAATDIAIKTVPDAAQFASSAISLVTSDLLSSSASATTVADAMVNILPEDIAGQLSTSATPPAEFDAMIDAFTGAYSAYQALSAGITASGGAYADPSISSGQKTEIAVNAAISGLLSSVVPVTGGSSSSSIAQALWSALRAPEHASSFLSFGSIDAVTGDGGTIGGLFSAAGL